MMTAQPQLSMPSKLQMNSVYLDRQAQFESNVRSYPRKLPIAIATAKGCWVTDVEGQQYLDCLAGAGTLALGHNHADILERLDRVLKSGLPLHTLDLTTPVKDEFCETLLSFLPDGGNDYCLQFCGPSGADAVEAAIKLAKTYTGRRSIISFSGGYHGMTHGALALTGNLSPKKEVSGLMPDVQFLPYPHDYRCPLGLGGEAGIAALTYYVEQFFDDVESGVCLPAAIILEAIQGEGGVNVAPVEWLKKIRQITQKHGILLIIDEVQTGFARTGDMFAYEHAGIQPDIIVMSKAVGGGLPLAVLAFKREFDAWQAGAHTGTFRGNQLAMAAGLATLNYIKNNNLIAHVTQQGNWLTQQFIRLQEKYPCIGQVRGRGLMLGLEIIDERRTPNHLGAYPADAQLSALIQHYCVKHGLLLERGGRHGTVVRLLPPLIINDQECIEVIRRFSLALDAALAECRGSSHAE
jgi:diaminobutyrate-2-oxoglutarate transaminase